MKIYKNRYTDELIGEKEYRDLLSFEKEDYIYYRSISGDTSSRSGDFLLSGAIACATDSAILGTLLGGSLLGGITGDLLDGDLMD